MPGLGLSKVAKVIHYGDAFLDEEIVIPQFDYAMITIEDIGIMQEALEKKKRQEILRKEYKQRQALQDIKDIFLDTFTLQTPNESKPIIEQLLEIVEHMNNEDQEANVKLMEWSERKVQGKVNEKISGDITLSQVELATKIEQVKKVLGNILSFYTKLCDLSLFTHKVGHKILSLEENLKLSSKQLS